MPLAREMTGWNLLHPADQQMLIRVEQSDRVRPARRSVREIERMSSDEWRLHRHDLEQWLSAIPWVDTATATMAQLQLASCPHPQANLDQDLQTVCVLTGRPGTGKSRLLRRAWYDTTVDAARLQQLHISAGRIGVDPEASVHVAYRPVIIVSLPGRLNDKGFIRAICEALSWPFNDRKSPWTLLEQAITRSGTHTIYIDEIQFVNFDSEAGRSVHNILKSLTNLGVRVVLAGHNLRSVLRVQSTAARELARVVSQGRWTLIDVEKLPYGDDAETRRDFDAVVDAILDNAILPGHDDDERIRTDEIGEYLWVRSLGYMNHATNLLRRSMVAALHTSRKRLTMRILEAIAVEQRVEEGRRDRIALWRTGHFAWERDWREKDDG